MKTTLTWLQRAENLIMGSAFIIMVIVLFIQVLNRNITKLSMPWTEEIAVYSMIYLVMLGTEAGLRDGTQIQITAIVDRFHGRAKLGIQIVAKAVVVAFSGAMAYASFGVVAAQAASGQTSPVLRIPIYVPFAAFLLAFTIIFAVQLAALVVLIKAFITNDAEASLGVVPETPDEVQELSVALGLEASGGSKHAEEDR